MERNNEAALFENPYLVAEIGCNHMGDMRIAHDMILIAAVFCKADAVKFQKRCIKELLTPEQYGAPHPFPQNAFGEAYGKHREFLEFSIEQHGQLKRWCDEFNIAYSCSVWDLQSARQIAGLSPKFIKVPSAANCDYETLKFLRDNFGGEIIISAGMTTRAEEKAFIDFFAEGGRGKDLTIMACTSGYPVPDGDLCLLEIKRLRETYGEKVKRVGFSSHHAGASLDIAAYALGAAVFERHFTLNHYYKGTDHIASLEPDTLRRVKRNLLSARAALTYKAEEILPIERAARDKLKRPRRGAAV